MGGVGFLTISINSLEAKTITRGLALGRRCRDVQVFFDCCRDMAKLLRCERASDKLLLQPLDLRLAKAFRVACRPGRSQSSPRSGGRLPLCSFSATLDTPRVPINLLAEL